MFTETQFRELVSGRRRGLSAALLRSLLTLLAVPYGLAVAWRNGRFDRGARPIHRVAVPVISVGNVTAGGTGKTPMVAWLAHWYGRQGLRVALISRGYGAETGARNDEALELERQLPQVPHLQDPDRVAAAQTAIEELDSQVLVLDDAFQHRRLFRDLDLVLIDALQPFGFGHLLPRGLLRESLRGLARADVIALSRCDLIPAEQRQRIRSVVRQHAPDAVWIEVAHRPHALLAWPDRQEALESLAQQRVAAFCGIGNPEGFRRTLEELQLDVVAFRTYPDHHRFDREDLRSLTSWAAETGATTLVCTQKDLVKLQADQVGSCRLRGLAVEIEIVSGREALEQELQNLMPRLA